LGVEQAVEVLRRELEEPSIRNLLMTARMTKRIGISIADLKDLSERAAIVRSSPSLIGKTGKTKRGQGKCSNSGSASRLHPELFRGAKTVVWHTDCSDSNRGAEDVTASRRSDLRATPDTAPVRLSFSGAAATVNFLPEELRLPSRRRSCDQVALPKVSKILKAAGAVFV
jgi:hypothetical protein